MMRKRLEGGRRVWGVRTLPDGDTHVPGQLHIEAPLDLVEMPKMAAQQQKKEEEQRRKTKRK